MTTFYIIDDEKAAVDMMISLLGNIPDTAVVGYATDPNQALEEIGSGKVKADITLVDIQMPTMSGLELAGLIYSRTVVIFVTAFGQFAARAFEEDIATDYILKPVSPERLLKGVIKAKQKNEYSKTKIHRQRRRRLFLS